MLPRENVSARLTGVVSAAKVAARLDTTESHATKYAPATTTPPATLLPGIVFVLAVGPVRLVTSLALMDSSVTHARNVVLFQIQHAITLLANTLADQVT